MMGQLISAQVLLAATAVRFGLTTLDEVPDAVDALGADDVLTPSVEGLDLFDVTYLWPPSRKSAPFLTIAMIASLYGVFVAFFRASSTDAALKVVLHEVYERI